MNMQRKGLDDYLKLTHIPGMGIIYMLVHFINANALKTLENFQEPVTAHIRAVPALWTKRLLSTVTVLLQGWVLGQCSENKQLLTTTIHTSGTSQRKGWEGGMAELGNGEEGRLWHAVLRVPWGCGTYEPTVDTDACKQSAQGYTTEHLSSVVTRRSLVITHVPWTTPRQAH